MSKKSWLWFLDQIKNAKNDLGFKKNEECFFRGHFQSSWQLLPGIFRSAIPSKTKLITAHLWDIESDLYYEFRSRARVLYTQEISDWDVLFSMQHHKVKTRLLDWTEMFGTAVYFALIGCSREGNIHRHTPCIWLMNPYILNELYHDIRDLWDPENLDYYNNDIGESYSALLLGNHQKYRGKMFYWNEPVALYPLRKDDRLTNQGGYFTIHGNNILPIEQLPGNEHFLRKIELPEEVIASAFDYIDSAGINDFTMFPDLDGLAQYLNRKYFN